MHNKLLSAKKLAESVRYSEDTLNPGCCFDKRRSDILHNAFCHNGLRITKEMTPRLYLSLRSTFNRLGICDDDVASYIYASPDIQAECYIEASSKCILRFTSSLIEILSEEEFSFVAGHELGHFILNHSPIDNVSKPQSLEYYIKQRAQEISADRLGLIACESLNIAIGALVKTISGLTSKHLNFDVGTFISQLKEASDNHLIDSSHPSIIVRCRSLLWFSINDDFLCNMSVFSKESMYKTDSLVQKELHKYIDGPARNKINQVKSDLAMWIAALNIVRHGRFERSEQFKFKEQFGESIFEKFIDFIRDVPTNNLENIVFEKMKASRDELELLIPGSFENEYARLIK